jgi:hypothetical protein
MEPAVGGGNLGREPSLCCNNRGDFESAKALIEHAEPIPVRRIDLDMSMQEFLGISNALIWCLLWNSLNLTGREFVEEQG